MRDHRALFAGYAALLIGAVGIVNFIIFLMIPSIVVSAGFIPAGILFLRASRHEGWRAAGFIVIGLFIAGSAMYLAQFLPETPGRFSG